MESPLIFAADDDKVSLMVLEKTIRDAGYRVMTAPDGEGREDAKCDET